jgi:two-component system, LytTR family, response regulator
MMKLNCVAIDDEPLALDLIRKYVEQIPELSLMQTFDDAIAGIEFLKSQPVDLLFLDINMPDISGIDLLKLLEQKPLTIFTTAYKKFAVEGFELEAVDYLVKPIEFERFKKAVNRAFEFYQYKQVSKPTVENLFVRSEYRLLKIELDEIDFIEGLEDYIRIHLNNKKPVMTLMTMKSVLEKLPADKFKRIHRSYIVAVDKVKSILNRKVQLASGKELPVSNNYTSFIDEWMKK